MLTIVVAFHVHPAHVQAFRQAIVANAGQSLAIEAGCRQFDVCCDPDDATLCFLYELYDDEAAFQAHLQSPHYLQMSALTADWVASKQVWRYQRLHPHPGADGRPVGTTT
jgi:(4S)-4-hydroxy-5-phosphonooxypentane-2,3-dione isomerase